MSNAPYPVGTHLPDQAGYIGGYISLTQDGVATHALILAPKDAMSPLHTGFPSSLGVVATSRIDGPGNHAALANFGRNFAIAVDAELNTPEYGGFSDWYVPADAEIDILWWNLKPVDLSNNTSYNPPNPWSVPPRGSDRTNQIPAQTQVPGFQSGEPQAFESGNHWMSTTGSSGQLRSIALGSGLVSISMPASSNIYVRAIRRVAIDDLITPPTDEEVFRSSFEAASGRDPLPTALLARTPARQLAGHNVNVYKYPPYLVTKRWPLPPEKYDLALPGKMGWFKDAKDPLFSMGRWAQVQGFRLTDDPNEVELTTRISDHPESFEAPT